MAAQINLTFSDITIERLTEKAWNIYRDKVGGKAYDGSPLKDWSSFKSSSQGQAWKAAVEGVITTKVNL